MSDQSHPRRESLAPPLLPRLCALYQNTHRAGNRWDGWMDSLFEERPRVFGSLGSVEIRFQSMGIRIRVNLTVYGAVV